MDGVQIALLIIGALLLINTGVMMFKVYRLTAESTKTSEVVGEIRGIHKRLTIGLVKLENAVDIMGVTNMPRDGFPQQMEACWEDVGKRGRFLTDLGGMSIKMREQMYEEFIKALNKPMPGTPAAGSFNDVMVDLDEWLTRQQHEKHDRFYLIQEHHED